MASLVSQKLEEKLVCSICLELFRVPVTLPCGHNFCKSCISDHWDKREQALAWAERGCTCPECRRGFEQRPELEKNVTLDSVVELARETETWALGIESCEETRGELCPQHGRPMELYCEDERQCICCVCTVRQCQQHRRVLFQEERSKKQVLLKESLEKAQEESEKIEQRMQELEERTHSIKYPQREEKASGSDRRATSTVTTASPATRTMATQTSVTCSVATQTPATGTATERENQRVPALVTPAHKNKYWKWKSTRSGRGKEASTKREREEEAYCPSSEEADDSEAGPSRGQEDEEEEEDFPASSRGRTWWEDSSSSSEGEEEITKMVTVGYLSPRKLRNMRKNFCRRPGEYITTWLLRCWDNKASSWQLEGRAVKQLGSLSREADIDRVIGGPPQAFSLWRRLLSGVKEGYPFKEDVLFHIGKWTTIEKGIQYLRELAVLEVIYYNLNDRSVSANPDEVMCTPSMWQQLVQNAPPAYAGQLLFMTWKDGDGRLVDELAEQLLDYKKSLASSPCTYESAVDELTDDLQRLEENIFGSPPAQTRMSGIRSKRFSAQERGCKSSTPRATLWFYLRDHGEDMRKWDGKPTSVLEARVRELKGKTIPQWGSSRKNAAPVSRGQFPRRSRRAGLTFDFNEGTSDSDLQEDSSEGLKSVILNKFSLLRKALEDCQWWTVARIEQEQAAALGHVEEGWSLLKDRLDVLSQHRERAQRLLACPDHRTFLQEFPLLPSLESPEVLLPVEFDAASVVKPIVEILTDISRLLLEDLPSSVAHKAPNPIGQGLMHPQGLAVKVVAPLPESQLRAELLKDHRNLTFDPETANKYLELSKGNHKAKHGPGTLCSRPEQGPRFEPWQVLCTQGYGHGHHYWEVKISNHSIIMGVTYHGLPWERQQGHKFNIGLDGSSWGLQVREDCYLAWHKGRAEKIQERLYKNLGVSLDYDKGLLSFYGLGERMQLIHSFHNVFTEPLYPVFWLCEGRAVTLCQRD